MVLLYGVFKGVSHHFWHKNGQLININSSYHVHRNGLPLHHWSSLMFSESILLLQTLYYLCRGYNSLFQLLVPVFPTPTEPMLKCSFGFASSERLFYHQDFHSHLSKADGAEQRTSLCQALYVLIVNHLPWLSDRWERGFNKPQTWLKQNKTMLRRLQKAQSWGFRKVNTAEEARVPQPLTPHRVTLSGSDCVCLSSYAAMVAPALNCFLCRILQL